MRLRLIALLSSLPLWAQWARPVASYDIRARLDPKSHVISGEQTLRLTPFPRCSSTSI